MSTLEKPSVCTLDCPDTCSLTVTVENDKIIRVRGSDALPYTAGVICNKVAHQTPQWVHGPQRLRHPLRRIGPRGSGQFERISWEAALDLIHERTSQAIERHGRETVMPLNYAGPHGILAMDSMSLRFFHKLGASQLYRGAMCGAVRREAWVGTYGAIPGLGPELAAQAKLNIVWGNNATVTNLHLVRGITQSRREGGRLVVIDPLRTRIAALADLHLAPLPGTDVLIAFALANELKSLGAHDAAFIRDHVLGYEDFMARAAAWPLEKAAQTAGVSAQDLRTLARWMVESNPMVISPGNGLERARNGGSGIRALIALPALMGRLDARNGIVLGAGNAFPRTPARLARPDLLPGPTRTLNILDVGRILSEDALGDQPMHPPVRAVFIYNHNPLVVHPDQNRLRRGFLREDIFTCGIEIAMTESMAYCDVVLPAATAYESDDLYAAYGQQWLQRAQAVVPAEGEALPNTEIFRRLAARFGFTDGCFADSDAQLMDDALNTEDARLAGHLPSQLPLDAATLMRAPDGEPFAPMVNVRPATPSGRIELASETLAQRWGEAQRVADFIAHPADQDDPREDSLALISPASDARISSTLLGSGGLAHEAPPLLMHPEDAAHRGLSDGMQVRVSNPLGQVMLRLQVSKDVPRGVVSSEKGAWLATSPNGQTISALVSATRRADLASGACYNDTRVQVSPAAA
ncbi:MAG: molybdopterin-dependent oxidoreductase [Burkholderiaceae bacterium]